MKHWQPVHYACACCSLVPYFAKDELLAASLDTFLHGRVYLIRCDQDCGQELGVSAGEETPRESASCLHLPAPVSCYKMRNCRCSSPCCILLPLSIKVQFHEQSRTQSTSQSHSSRTARSHHQALLACQRDSHKNRVSCRQVDHALCA